MTALSSVFHSWSGGKPYVIAEAGVNHGGDVGLAHQLIDAAVSAGADAVKYQTFDPMSLVSADAQLVDYQRSFSAASTQRELLQRLVLPTSAWAELRSHAVESGIDFLSTAFDVESLDLICHLGVPALKLGSGELTNKPLLMEVATRGLPVICSTGMASLTEVRSAVEWLVAAPALLLMHCVSAYPAPVSDCNLLAMVAMRDTFDLPVGWSDHTIGDVSAVVATTLGAVAIEKHLTLDPTAEGPDHAASASPEAFRRYVTAVHNASLAIGDGNKRLAVSEAGTRSLVRRSWHARRNLEVGAVLTRDDLLLLRPESGARPDTDLVGRRVRRSVAAGEPIQVEDFEEGLRQ